MRAEAWVTTRPDGASSVADIRWSPQAIHDVQSIKSYISRDSPIHAGIVARRIVQAAERLAAFPESGRVVPEFGDPRVREVLWQDYRIVYRIAGDGVEIATVFHGSLPIDATRD